MKHERAQRDVLQTLVEHPRTAQHVALELYARGMYDSRADALQAVLHDYRGCVRMVQHLRDHPVKETD